MNPPLSSCIEYSYLQPTTLLSHIQQLCSQAQQHNYASVCIPPLFVKKAKSFLINTHIKIATVIGYPYGYSATEAKLAEIVLAILDGADELDVTINMAALKNNDWQYLAQELNAILPIVKSKQKTIKIIIETMELTNDEIIKCCDLYGIAGVDYLQAGTGVLNADSDIEKIKLIRQHLTDAVGIKAIIKSNNNIFAEQLVKAGSNRLGYFSN